MPTWIETPNFVQSPPTPEYIERSRQLLAAIVCDVPLSAEMRQLGELLLARLPEHAPAFAESARVAGFDPLHLLAATLSYDLAMNLACSTMALATENGPLIARNMDWPYTELVARASCMMPTTHGIQAGFAGSVGVVSGMNDRFAMCLNATGGERLNIAGYPMLLFVRHLIDTATDFDNALRLAETTPLMSCGLLTLIGTRNNQRAIVERTPTRHATRRPTGDEPLVVTNHYRKLEYIPYSCPRYSRLSELAPTLGERPTDTDLLTTLTDREVLQSITAQHVVLCPARGEARMWVPTVYG